MYIPTTTHVAPLATIRRERLLPQPGYVLIDEGERVEATTVVARTETISKHFYYDLTQMLDVSVNDVTKYLRVQVDVAVSKGEMLAQRPTLLGLGSIPVRAPAKGAVVEIKDGRLLFAAAGPGIQVRAGFPGVVASVNPEWGVVIETPGALIQGVWGSGKQEFGSLKMLVNDAAQPLAVELLDASCKGAIVVAGMTDEAGLQACVKAKVRGLILGSLSANLFKTIRGLPFPVLIVEGFGKQVMPIQAWSLFADHNGRDVYLDARAPDRWEGRRPEIIIPLPHPGGAVPLPADGQPLSEGKRVRIARPPYASAVGVVTQLPARMEILPNGVQAQVAQVDLEAHGLIVAPVANLEIYE